ncbi:unnamed protein product [Thlaspi arvense]|uniref:Uncharacterized protein n=1 Tax=Thlaspi arvense TaxID=13288 RepID=A0AAU9T8G7_THLAR|nr:unnamed protein product [Thlaspi arvense]
MWVSRLQKERDFIRLCAAYIR